MNIEPDTEQVEILPLIIQPLVENSIIHGLENKEEGATLVQVYVYRTQEGVRIEVIDDGAGISQDKLLEIHSHLECLEEEAPDGRIGLRNVHDRLILSYGKPYGLQIDSGEGKGTRVSFLIPKEGHIHV
ncbi:Sensor histidine kinase YpdA [compost metagenome]